MSGRKPIRATTIICSGQVMIRLALYSVASSPVTHIQVKTGLGMEKRYYMDMDCYDCVPADEKSAIGIEELEKAVPGIDWRRGHSGELLSSEDADRLNELWNNIMEQD